MGKGRACGKLIVTGEHFVVHGTPAIAIPLLSRHVAVEVRRESGKWDVPTEAKEHLTRIVEKLGERPQSVSLTVRSTLPSGAGLGGSAALAVALVRALDDEAGQHQTSESVCRRAHELEKIAHGRPSGIDDSVVAYEQAVRLDPGKGLTPIRGAQEAKMWVGLSPERTATKVAVAKVAERAAARPDAFQNLLLASRECVQQAETSLVRGDWPALGAVLTRTHGLLREVGVSTTRLDALVDAALAAGAYGAKLTGAGLGGAVIALGPDDLDFEAVWQRAGVAEVIAP
jgi:mevalonate kinase